MEIPLNFYFDSENYPYPKYNTVNLPIYEQSDYQMELFISEFFLNSGLYMLSKENLLTFEFYNPEVFNLTTDLLYIIVGKGILKEFSINMPCSATLSTIDPTPSIDLKANQSNI